MQTIIHEKNCCWTVRDAVALLRRFPVEESLPLVKEWLAGQGYGIAKCKLFADGSCDKNCPFAGYTDRRETKCGLDAFDGNVLECRPGDGCPAMIARGKG